MSSKIVTNAADEDDGDNDDDDVKLILHVEINLMWNDKRWFLLYVHINVQIHITKQD